MAALYNVPPVALLFGAIVLAVALACLGQIYVHRQFRQTDFVQHNEVGGFIIAVVGTLYAVLLGFFTIVIWQHYAEAQEQVSLESAAAVDAWHAAVGLPHAVRTRIRHDLLAYANIMIGSEWPAMRRGSYDPQADIVVMDAMDATGTLTRTNLRESTAQLTTQQQLTTMHDGRVRRLTKNRSGARGFEWLVLWIGFVCVLCFCWLFGLRNARAHLLMTSTVAVVMVSSLVLLFELQHPFRSKIGIGSDAWSSFVEHVRLMQNGPQQNMRM